MIKSMINDLEVNIDQSDQVVPWWSFTKTILASAIIKLAEQGKFSLDDFLQGKTYTYRNLLQHTSGLTDYGFLHDYHSAVKNRAKPWSIEELFERVQVENLKFSPGKGWGYSNIGYLILKKEVERICNNDLETAFNKLFFEEIGITDTRVIKTVKEYSALESTESNYDPGWCYHGLLAGTTESAARFLSLLSSGKIVKAESLREMLIPYKLNFNIGNRPWKHPAVGLGIMLDYGERLTSYGHTGQGPESTIAVYHFIKEKPVTVAVYEKTDDPSIVENKAVELSASSASCS